MFRFYSIPFCIPQKTIIDRERLKRVNKELSISSKSFDSFDVDISESRVERKSRESTELRTKAVFRYFVGNFVRSRTSQRNACNGP